jgi:hypothetical protein
MTMRKAGERPMTVYGERESLDGTLLNVDTDYHTIVGVATQTKSGYLIAFLDRDDVAKLLGQLRDWLVSQEGVNRL